MKQNNIGNETKADIIFINHTVMIQTSNGTLSNKVEPGDLSKEGLVPPEKLEVIKKKIESVTALIIEDIVKTNKFNKHTLDDNNSIDYYNTDTFTVQTINYNKANQGRNNRHLQEQIDKEFNDIQIKKKISQVDFNQCSLELKKYYNFSSSVLISKIDYDPKLTSRSSIGDASIAYYSPVTGEPLPFEKICSGNRLNIKFPILDIKIEKEDYDKYKKDGFNIYDSKSKFYFSRCAPLINLTSEGDITINERIENIYKNLSISCGEKCLFNEIDFNNYSVCDCIQKNNTKAFIEKVLFDTYSTFNFDIITCLENFTLVFNILKNFYFILFIF